MDLHQSAAVEEKPWPPAVGSKSPGSEGLVDEEAFDCFGRLVSIQASMFNSELFCYHVGQFFDVVRHLSKSPDNWPDYPAALAIEAELRFEAIARVTFPCIE